MYCFSLSGYLPIGWAGSWTPASRRFHDRDRGGRHRQFLRGGSAPSPAWRPGKPDPSTGQTASVAAPIKDVLSKGDWLLDPVRLSRSQQDLGRW